MILDDVPITVCQCETLHTDALHATGMNLWAFVLSGNAFRVSALGVSEMTERGLARMQ